MILEHIKHRNHKAVSLFKTTKIQLSRRCIRYGSVSSAIRQLVLPYQTRLPDVGVNGRFV